MSQVIIRKNFTIPPVLKSVFIHRPNNIIEHVTHVPVSQFWHCKYIKGLLPICTPLLHNLENLCLLTHITVVEGG